MEAIDSILKLSQVGSLGLCLFALFGAARGWWAPGWVYRESQARESAWRELYLREKAQNERLSGQEAAAGGERGS